MEGNLVQTETVTDDPDLTWLPVREALELVTATGFTILHAHDNFTFKPAPEDAANLNVTDKKTGRRSGGSGTP